MEVQHSHAATGAGRHTRATMYGLAGHARHYERCAGVLARPLYRRVVADVRAAALPAGAVVLDVGTGPGLVPEALVRACPDLSVVGIDLAPQMVARARERTRGTAGLRFEVADVTGLPFPDASMDLVVSSLSLHHWEHPDAGLADVVRVLRPGAEAWVYDGRGTLRRATADATGLPADVTQETLPGGLWLRPFGRLVLRRKAS